MLVHRNLRFSPLKKAIAALISAFVNPCKQVASLDIDGMTEGGTPTLDSIASDGRIPTLTLGMTRKK